MDKGAALNQLCKMQAQVAKYFDKETLCVCGESSFEGPMSEVPNEVIAWLWEAIHEKELRMRRKEGKEDDDPGK